MAISLDRINQIVGSSGSNNNSSTGSGGGISINRINQIVHTDYSKSPTTVSTPKQSSPVQNLINGISSGFQNLTHSLFSAPETSISKQLPSSVANSGLNTTGLPGLQTNPTGNITQTSTGTTQNIFDALGSIKIPNPDKVSFSLPFDQSQYAQEMRKQAANAPSTTTVGNVFMSNVKGAADLIQSGDPLMGGLLADSGKILTIGEAIKGALVSVGVASTLEALSGMSTKDIIKSAPMNAVFGLAFAGKDPNEPVTKSDMTTIQKAVDTYPSKVMTLSPQDLVDHVQGTNLNGTELGNKLITVADQAQKEDKYIQVIPNGENALGKTPDGISLGYQLLAKNDPIVKANQLQLLSEEGVSKTAEPTQTENQGTQNQVPQEQPVTTTESPISQPNENGRTIPVNPAQTDHTPPEGFTPQVSKGLTDQGKVTEKITQNRAANNYDTYKTQYLKDNATYDANGKLQSVVLNTDNWREYFPEYKGTNAQDVHEAASYLNNRLFKEMLDEQKGKGNNTVAIYAGGGGSGKGTAIEPFFDQSQFPIILDGTFADYLKNSKKIDQIEKAGYKAKVIFVDRNPTDAVENVVGRAQRLEAKGKVPRTVPVKRAVEDNINARRSMIQYIRDHPNEKTAVIDNNHGIMEAKTLITDPKEAIDYLKSKVYNKDEVTAKAYESIKQRIATGEIKQHIGEGLIGKDTFSSGSETTGHVQLQSGDKGTSGGNEVQRSTESKAHVSSENTQPKSPSGSRETKQPESVNPTKESPSNSGIKPQQQSTVLEKEYHATSQEIEKYKNFPEKKTFTEPEPPNFKGINPDNIVHFNQGMNERVSMIVSAEDKNLIHWGAAHMKAIKGFSDAAKTFREGVNYVSNRYKLGDQEARKMIIDTYNKYRNLAKENADKNNPVLINTLAQKAEDTASKAENPVEVPKVENKSISINDKGKEYFREKINTAMQSSDNPARIVTSINKMVRDETANASPTELRNLKAELNKERFDIAGVDAHPSSKMELKKNYAYLMNAEKDPIIGPMIEAINDHVAQLSAKLEESKQEKPIEGKLISDNTPELQKVYGEGKPKTPKLSLRVEETAIKKGIMESIEKMPELPTMNMDKMSQRVIDLMKEDPQRMYDIAMGREKAPEDIPEGFIFNAVKQSITTPEQAIELANSPIAEHGKSLGQQIKAFDSFKIAADPVEAIKQVITKRASDFEKKSGSIDKAINDTIKEIQDHIEKTAPDKVEWQKFIESIRC